MRVSPVVCGCLFLTVAASFVACSERPVVHAIESTRVVLDDPPASPRSSAARFGGAGAFGMPQSTPSAGALAWELPSGWEQLPAKPPRTGSFAVPGGVDASLTTLPGPAGGVAANVNRWRGQLGLPELDDAALDALPRETVLGEQAVRVDLRGSYTGMGEGGTLDDARMLAYIVSDAARTVFVKLVGPADAVAAQVEHFDAFAASLSAGAAAADGHVHTEGDGHVHTSTDAAAAADDPHAGMPGFDSADPHAGMPGFDAPSGDPHAGLDNAPGARGSDPLGLHWDAPAGWHTGPERALRVATLLPASAPEAECSMVALAGDGGGLLPNVNLWRSQLGLQPWDDAQLAQAPVLGVMGRPALRVHFEGAGDAAGRDLIGLVCPLETHTLFVKLVGPHAQLHELGAEFDELCLSLER